MQTSTITPATRATRSPTTTANTAAAQGQMPVSWTRAAPSWNGILLWNAALRTKGNLANMTSAPISLWVSDFFSIENLKECL